MTLEKHPDRSLVNLDTFTQMDLRTAYVLEASAVEGSEKLISLLLDVGSMGKKHVFTALRPFVNPDDLLGKTVVLIANLIPRKMRFGISQGMVLSVGEGSQARPLIVPDALAGERIN